MIKFTQLLIRKNNDTNLKFKFGIVFLYLYTRQVPSYSALLYKRLLNSLASVYLHCPFRSQPEQTVQLG